MLQLSDALLNRPVLSLRIGGQVATALEPIINPNNLKVEGFWCQDTIENKRLILVNQDIRDVIPQGIVINDYDVLTEPGELVRLRDIIQLDFELMGKPVITSSKDKVGKITDYATDIDSMYIQKLYVSQSLLRNFSGGNLGVDRSQIVEINPQRIVINDLLQHVPAGAGAMA